MEFRTRFLLSEDETTDPDSATEFVAVLTLKGVGLSTLSCTLFQFLRSTFTISQSHYPETMGHTVVLHAGIVFKMVWKAVQLCLHEHTKSKITVCSDNGLATLDALWGGRNRVPASLGGSCTCGCDGNRAWGVYLDVCRRGVDAMGGWDAVRLKVREAFGITSSSTPAAAPPPPPPPTVAGFVLPSLLGNNDPGEESPAKRARTAVALPDLLPFCGGGGGQQRPAAAL